jgi:hypothetical protein
MRKTKKNRTVKKKNKCVYTDEARRLLKVIKEIKRSYSKKTKTLKKK